ncbi:MAG: hypothetical protein IJI45_14170 [Anaerolineaceae bacterium]|nr:hypothetical protein [Anaerolineaceae bacterium]
MVYERTGGVEMPVLAIELDGKEHLDDEVVKMRDRQKNQICRDHQFELIRVKIRMLDGITISRIS